MRITGRNLKQIIREEVSLLQRSRRLNETNEMIDQLRSTMSLVVQDLDRAAVSGYYHFDTDVGAKDGEIIIIMGYFNDKNMAAAETQRVPDDFTRRPIPEADAKMRRVAEMYKDPGSDIFEIPAEEVMDYANAHTSVATEHGEHELGFLQGDAARYLGMKTGIRVREPGFRARASRMFGTD